MMTLIRLLPFMIGNFVETDDNHWHCFLQLWDICNIVCTFKVTDSDTIHLAWLVEAYLEELSTLYNMTTTPNLHYLLHLPKQLSLRVDVCMAVNQTTYTCIYKPQIWITVIPLVHET